jgi:hypothetical protein
MKRIAASMICLGSLAACVITGCGGDGTDGDQPATNEPAKAQIKTIDVSTLPEANVFMPPLDEGRVELTGPDGWTPMVQREAYLAGFYPKGTGAGPPRVLIKADDAPAGSPTEVTAAEVGKFEAYIMPILKQELAGRKDVREPPRVLVIGDRPWARYVMGRSYKSMPMDEQVLKTVANGRIYRIELTVAHQPGRIEFRDHAYAIAAGMKFPRVAAAEGAGDGGESLGDLLGSEEGKPADEEAGGDEKAADDAPDEGAEADEGG